MTLIDPAVVPPNIALVVVPSGAFTLGRLEGYDHSEREDPAHHVMLGDYSIGRYPITNAQYLPFVRDTGHPPPRTWDGGAFPEQQADHPVSGIVWGDAWLYCAWLRLKTCELYHLPTEAQWEKAATWDPQTNHKHPYPWGNTEDVQLCNVGLSNKRGTTPVGSYSPQGDSSYGCADMIGNVDEWCQSILTDYPYQAGDGREEDLAGGRRALRAPPVVEAYLLRGRIYEGRGQMDEALSDYLHYALWMPNAPETPALLRRLSEERR